jgi:small subunit ribosomal protein S14
MLFWKNKKDNKKRYKFLQAEKKRLILKFCLQRKLKASTRVQLSIRYYNLKGKQTVIQNRCLQSSNAHSVYRQYKLSRMFLKNYAHKGLLPGVIKYNW